MVWGDKPVQPESATKKLRHSTVPGFEYEFGMNRFHLKARLMDEGTQERYGETRLSKLTQT